MDHRRLASVVAAVLLWLAGIAATGELHVMTSGTFTAAYQELAPQFERQTGHRMVTEATSVGAGDSSIEARLRRGEAIDVVIVDTSLLDRLIEEGRVVAGTRVDLARSMIGMAVRKGAPKPDISSVGGLTRALLAARSIAYSGSVSGTYVSTELLQRLGIAEEVLPKTRLITAERVGAVVARGDAEIGFQQISELLPVPGIDIVGPLPPEVQRASLFAAGVGAAATDPEGARRFIAFLASPAARPAIEKSALEPVAAALGG
jgi:molybdate transport system substrate-binding protein